MSSKPTLCLIICGDRCASTNIWAPIIRQQLLSLLQTYDICGIIHGACRGIDTISAAVAKELLIPVMAMPANWSLGAKAGPIRNQQMLIQLQQIQSEVKMILAFHPDIEKSRGTANMVRQGKTAGISTAIICGS